MFPSHYYGCLFATVLTNLFEPGGFKVTKSSFVDFVIVLMISDLVLAIIEYVVKKFKQWRKQSHVPFLIGFNGKKGSGKDTAAKAFPGAVTLAFAEPLKEAAIHLFGLSREQVYDETLKEVVDPRYDKTPRQLLQWLGCDIMRDQFDEDHWLHLMRERMTKHLSDHDDVIITDVRFDNECELVREHGGVVMRILREQPGKSEDSHASEKGVNPELVSTDITNDKTIRDLHEAVRLAHRVLVQDKKLS